MTNTQQKLYDFIKSYIHLTGEGPTYSAMRDHMGFSSNQAIKDILDVLEKNDFIKIKASKKGGIVLGKKTVQILDRKEILKTKTKLETTVKESIAGNSNFFVSLSPISSNVSEVLSIKSATQKGREKWNGTP